MPASLSTTYPEMVCEYNLQHHHHHQEQVTAPQQQPLYYHVDYAAELNDQGNHCLEIGDFDQAMTYYRSALVSVSGDLSNAAATNVTLADPAHVHATYERPDSIKSFRPQQQQRSHNQQPVQYIYSQGLPLIKNQCFSSQALLENQKVRSSIVVFNLALVIHLKAMRQSLHQRLTSTMDKKLHVGQSSHPNYILLQKAQSLYRKACYLLRQHTPSSSQSTTSQSVVVDLMYLACMNNLAEVCFELGDYQDSSTLFRQVITCSSRALQLGQGDNRIGAVHLKEQAKLFMQNAMVPGMHPPPMTARCA